MTIAFISIMNFILAFMEDYSILLYLVGFLGTIITVVYMAAKTLVNKDPIIEIIKSYKKYPKFSELQFEVDENNTVIGKINELRIELTPKLRGDSDLYFLLTIRSVLNKK